MKRIQKRTAEKLYKNHQKFYMIPCKLNPESPWGLKYDVINFDEPFECLYNSFVYYNCNWETGYYPAFYVD